MKYAITLDWISLNLSGSVALFEECPVGFRCGNFVFIVGTTGTKHYKYLAKIQYKGRVFGEIQFAPRSPILPAESSQLKIENCILYENGLADTIKEFFESTKLTIKGVSRLDIAFDFEKFNDGTTPIEFINQLSTNQLQRAGRATALEIKYAGAEITGAKWGTLKSDRAFSLYNKTKEIQKSNKVYISETHRANGLGLVDGVDVWRLEARLKGAELKKLFKLDKESGELTNLHLFEFLEPSFYTHVFEKELHSYWTFLIPDENQKRRSRWDVADLVRLDLHEPQKLLRYSARPGVSLYRVKISIKSLLENYYKNKNQRAFTMACELIEENDLMKHVDKRLPFWKREFFPSMDADYNYMNPLVQIALAKSQLDLLHYSSIKSYVLGLPKVVLPPTVWKRAQHQRNV
jgi:hypothetical protein